MFVLAFVALVLCPNVALVYVEMDLFLCVSLFTSLIFRLFVASVRSYLRRVREYVYVTLLFGI